MKQLGKAAFWMVLIVSAVIFILPFWFMLCNSFEEFSYVLPNPPLWCPCESASRRMNTSCLSPRCPGRRSTAWSSRL